MAAPNLISTRRLPGSVRTRLQVLFARAWEALADTYQMQAVEFVRRLRGRLPFDEALDRYFREVGVPAAMVDTVRARALIAMARDCPRRRASPSFRTPPPGAPSGPTSCWRRSAGARSTSRAPTWTAGWPRRWRTRRSPPPTCAMALETAELLVDECTPDDAIMHYIRTFNLPALDAQIIFRRTLALWAERDPLGLDGVEPVSAAAPAPVPPGHCRPRATWSAASVSRPSADPFTAPTGICCEGRAFAPRNGGDADALDLHHRSGR